MAAARRAELDIARSYASELGRTAKTATELGWYSDAANQRVDWSAAIDDARRAAKSIRPDDELPGAVTTSHERTRVQVVNETTLQAAKQLVEAGAKVLALNFANGIHPGGGFLNGARAQEEALCRSSALYATLVDDPMYAHHRARPRPDSTAWAILSPNVPVFRTDAGQVLDTPWNVSFLTCAAPVAKSIGQPESGDLLQKRIERVLAIARAYGYEALVLGAWGCGAFGNDPHRTACDFRHALESEFSGAFADVIFAVTDWSPDRATLRPFCEVFSPTPAGLRAQNVRGYLS